MPLVLLCLALAACGDGGDAARDGDPSADGTRLPDAVVAWEGAMVFTTPSAPPVQDAVLIVVDGVVEAVGPRGSVQIPQAARRRNASGLSVVAGLWNADVRMDDELADLIESGDAVDLALALEDRFTRYGITTVVFTEADSEVVAELRQRVADEGIPSPWILGPTDVPGGVARAHQQGVEAWDAEAPSDALLDILLAEQALIPGLTRMSSWREGEMAESVDRRVDRALDALYDFVDMGGALVMGTGAGWISDWDPSTEFILMDDAGLSFEEILSAATYEPSIRMRGGSDGEVGAGAVADLVFVEGDPSSDLSSLSRVREVFIEGFSVHEAGAGR